MPDACVNGMREVAAQALPRRGSLPSPAPNQALQATAYSVRCAAVVHAASPLQMGRIQRISLGQRLT